MKKSVIFVIAVIIAVPLWSNGDSQAYINVVGPKDNKAVDGAVSGIIYSVDIIWEDMRYVTKADKKGISSSNKYVWSSDGDEIKVVNHSNVDIKVKFTGESLEKYKDLKISFDKKDGLKIPSAVGKKLDDKELVAKVNMKVLDTDNKSDKNIKEEVNVGIVTVEIKDVK